MDLCNWLYSYEWLVVAGYLSILHRKTSLLDIVCKIFNQILSLPACIDLFHIMSLLVAFVLAEDTKSVESETFGVCFLTYFSTK